MGMTNKNKSSNNSSSNGNWTIARSSLPSSLQHRSTDKLHGGFTFIICPHGSEYNVHAEIPVCCEMQHQLAPHEEKSSNVGLDASNQEMKTTSNSSNSLLDLSASPSASTSTSISSTPVDYLQLGLTVHPLTDPYLMSNCTSSWWTSLHFSIIRIPCYLLAIVCGLLLGFKAMLISILFYFRGRPHDVWDMDDEQMATNLIREYQNLLSRLEAPPHNHPVCECGAPVNECSYFVFDARAISIYIPFRGLHVAPSISTLIAHRNGRCSIFSINIHGHVLLEASAGLDSWKLAKLYVRQAQLYIILSASHPLTHFSNEAFQAVTDHFFAPQDIISQLVAPHAEWNREINSYAMLAEGSVLNAREGASWSNNKGSFQFRDLAVSFRLFGIHTCARVHINKMMRAWFNERAHSGLSTMHAFPSRERIFSQPFPRMQINIKGKDAPRCWDEQQHRTVAADANSLADCTLRSITSPIKFGLENWLSVNPSFYPYYVATFEFVSDVLNSHQGQMQISDKRETCKQYLRSLKHYLRADYSIVHTRTEQTTHATESVVSAAIAELSSLTQSLAVVLTEYIFNVSFVHSGQHHLLGQVEPSQYPACIRIPWTPSVSLSWYNQPLLPRSVYTLTDLFRSHVYFATFVQWWNNKVYANHEIIRTHYSFENSGSCELIQAVYTFKLALRRAEKEHFSISKERKLTPVPLSRICRTIEW